MSVEMEKENHPIRNRPQTNFDCVQAMGVEELASVFAASCDNRPCPMHKIAFSSSPLDEETRMKVCGKCWLDWLQKEKQT